MEVHFDRHHVFGWMCVYIYSIFKNVYIKIRSLNVSVWSFDL